MSLKHLTPLPITSQFENNVLNAMDTPVNAVTGKAYSGNKARRLQQTALYKGFHENSWATMRQWNSVRQTIAKGQKGLLVLYYEKPGVKDGDGFMQARRVFLFNRCQLESYKAG